MIVGSYITDSVVKEELGDRELRVHRTYDTRVDGPCQDAGGRPMMAPTILKGDPDDSVSVRRKSWLRGLGRHESRLHQASEDRFAFPVVHCVFMLLLDCKTDSHIFQCVLFE